MRKVITAAILCTGIIAGQASAVEICRYDIKKNISDTYIDWIKVFRNNNDQSKYRVFVAGRNGVCTGPLKFRSYVNVRVNFQGGGFVQTGDKRQTGDNYEFNHVVDFDSTGPFFNCKDVDIDVTDECVF